MPLPITITLLFAAAIIGGVWNNHGGAIAATILVAFAVVYELGRLGASLPVKEIDAAPVAPAQRQLTTHVGAE